MNIRSTAIAALAAGSLLAAAPAATGVATPIQTAAVSANPSTAANEYGSYRLAGVREYWTGPVPASATARVDRIDAGPLGGSIEFTQRATNSSAECVGVVQRFKFSWIFNRDVTTLAGGPGASLVIMSTLWEGDSGNACVDEDPFVWIRSGGRYGPAETNAVNGDTFRLAFVNAGGENRVYFKGGGASHPTVLMNGPHYPTAGIEIQPMIRFLGTDVHVVYVYERMPDAPALKTPVVKAKAVSRKGKLKVDVNPNRGSRYWTFQVQVLNVDGTWTTLAKVYRTHGRSETRTLNFKKGVYRAVTLPRTGYGPGYSAAVRLVR